MRKNALGDKYDAVQARVNEILNGTASAPAKKSVSEIAKEVLAGAWGNGDARKQKLEAAGYNYSEVQAKVNSLAGGSSSSVDIDALARRVIAGEFGSGDARKKALGSNYDAVQTRVNEMLGGSSSSVNYAAIAKEVINGKWGNGAARKKKLEAAGYNYKKVQKEVNKLL